MLYSISKLCLRHDLVFSYLPLVVSFCDLKFFVDFMPNLSHRFSLDAYIVSWKKDNHEVMVRESSSGFVFTFRIHFLLFIRIHVVFVFIIEFRSNIVLVLGPCCIPSLQPEARFNVFIYETRSNLDQI